ncbi:hypothetical protein PFUGPA_02695 [Plasmodium falciparum Palo Alto/Uganda]|uniref:Rifin n=1 Tax=Plasmodium falciparum (isolate Palo Alto / Uganda) TaxID=57270 RepID=W4J105_PLAFP|nr:hypothetical protein PFUGPA_02695 [Plasmodium falciparum Palo Alto/Uganda]
MKLHYIKILLFSLPLNILVHDKNKPYITPHTPTTTSRVLSECDIPTSNYDNDADMKSVKENFDRQTSQRFDEYEERMSKKRQKCKEQCEKDIKQIILKDKMEKSLAEKVEKGCLRCGCGLGGVAASVGIFGTVAVKELTKAAITTAMELAKEAAEQAGAAAAADAGKNAVIAGLQEMGISTVGVQGLQSYFVTTDYTNALTIFRAINNQYEPSSCIFYLSGTRSVPVARETFCTWVNEKLVGAVNVERSTVSTNALVKKTVETIVSDAKKAAAAAVKKATDESSKNYHKIIFKKYIFKKTIILI